MSLTYKKVHKLQCTEKYLQCVDNYIIKNENAPNEDTS